MLRASLDVGRRLYASPADGNLRVSRVSSCELPSASRFEQRGEPGYARRVTPLRIGTIFLALSILAGMVWFAIEMGSPLLFFAASPAFIVVGIVAALLFALAYWAGLRWLPDTVAIWLPAVLVSVLVLLAANGFFLPANPNPEWFGQSVVASAILVAIPALASSTILQVRAVRNRAHHEARDSA
jgi:uncharacterized membrane protein